MNPYTKLEHLSTIAPAHISVRGHISTLETRWGILTRIRQTIALPSIGDIHEALKLIQAELVKEAELFILMPHHALSFSEREIKEQFFAIKTTIALIERIDGQYGASGKRDRFYRSRCPRRKRIAA